MNVETIEAGVLQEKTRDLLDLLQRIHELKPAQPLPVGEVADFARQAREIFFGRLFVRPTPFESREDCYISWPDDWLPGRDPKV